MEWNVTTTNVVTDPYCHDDEADNDCPDNDRICYHVDITGLMEGFEEADGDEYSRIKRFGFEIVDSSDSIAHIEFHGDSSGSVRAGATDPGLTAASVV